MAKRTNKKKQPSSFKRTPHPHKKEEQKHVQESLPTKWKLIIGAAIAVLAMLVYAPSYAYDFVYDDDAVVKENKFVKEGLGGLDKIWTTTYFKGYDENINARAFRPVPLTTLALEYEIGGLNPSFNHITNILYYGLTCLILFLFLAKLLRAHHPVFPILVTLFFALHPIHIEVVANIKSRDSMLGFMNLILALWLLLKFVDHKKLPQLFFSLLFYAIALFSKEEVITSVATLPVMLYCFRNFSMPKSLKYVLPYLGLALFFLTVRSDIILGNDFSPLLIVLTLGILIPSIRSIVAKKPKSIIEIPIALLAAALFFKATDMLEGFQAGVNLTHLDNSLLAAKGLAETSASKLLVVGHYLLKTIFPHPLISDYSFSTIPLTSWSDWRVYLSLVFNLGLFVLSIIGIFRRKAWGFGLFWYFATVSIFTSIITTNVSAYNDRFLFTPVLGICFSLAWLVSRMAKSAKGEPQLAFLKNNLPLVAITLVISALSIFKIASHLPMWENRYVLFEHDAKLTPTNARTRKNHGGSLARKALELQQNDPIKMAEYANAAIGELEAAIKIYPKMPTGHIHKGNMHVLLKDYESAVAAFSEALRQSPKNYFAKSSLGIAYFYQGKYGQALSTLESIPPHLRRESDKQMMERCRSARN